MNSTQITQIVVMTSKSRGYSSCSFIYTSKKVPRPFVNSAYQCVFSPGFFWEREICFSLIPSVYVFFIILLHDVMD